MPSQSVSAPRAILEKNPVYPAHDTEGALQVLGCTLKLAHQRLTHLDRSTEAQEICILLEESYRRLVSVLSQHPNETSSRGLEQSGR